MSKGYIYRGLRERLKLNSSDYRKLYQSWIRMKNRCYDPNNASYEHYRKHGIEVCEEWKTSFEPFALWAVENGWDSKLTLDRIDNAGNYEPLNCRWTSQKVQARNRSTCIYITHDGVTRSLIEWCEFFNIPHHLPLNRINRGYTDFSKIFAKVDYRTGGVLNY